MGIFEKKENDASNQSGERLTPKPVEKKVETKAQAEPTPAAAAAGPAPKNTQLAASTAKAKAKEQKPPMSCVYGPIGSWRLGRTLGIDLLCTEERTCNFDCVYCQLPAGQIQTERQEFVTLSKVFDDINAAKGVDIDWVAFAGMGEPTLATNLGEAIAMAKSILGKPVAVFTNGSLLKVKEVRKALAEADMVILKLDAFDDASFNAINRPTDVSSLDKMLQQWQIFRVEYRGKIAISVMASELNKGGGHGLRYKSMLVMADQIQLNTPLNSDKVKPLSQAEFADIKQWFWNFKEVKNVYDANTPVVAPLNAEETARRHPTKTAEKKSE